MTYTYRFLFISIVSIFLFPSLFDTVIKTWFSPFVHFILLSLQTLSFICWLEHPPFLHYQLKLAQNLIDVLNSSLVFIYTYFYWHHYPYYNVVEKYDAKFCNVMSIMYQILVFAIRAENVFAPRLPLVLENLLRAYVLLKNLKKVQKIYK